MRFEGKKVKFDWVDYILIGSIIGVAVGAYFGYQQGANDTLQHLQQLPHYPYPGLNGS
ncbi:TPA: hypothetical protein HA338_08875 [Methanosarcina acetivorans]|uniref:Uncharacterized protein n=1 Tax=Methanosarcina acetivorans TaxID=2214 RepID=A0A832SEZ1_9EURY|nr:hypothetical protein [Methanosarcina acetivorans]HIH94141.1 hypothetical protein [Methanosarcina acetivorans]